MSRPQFSLSALAALVALAAVSCAALVYASDLWSATLFSVLVLVLIAALVMAVYRDGAARAGWLGLAVFGWCYLLLAFWPSSDRQQFVAWYRMDLGSQLATSHLARWAYVNVLPKVRKPPPAPSGGGFGGGFGGGGLFFQFGAGGGGQGAGGGGMGPAQGAAPAAYYPDEETFIRVFHAVSACWFALLGACFARWAYGSRRSPSPGTATPPG